jgi:hypothetical protein
MRQLAQLPQFLVGEIQFFFSSGAFQMTQSGIFREAAQFGSGYAKQEGGSGLGHKLWDIIRQIVHGLPQSARLRWRQFRPLVPRASEFLSRANFSPTSSKT